MKSQKRRWYDTLRAAGCDHAHAFRTARAVGNGRDRGLVCRWESEFEAWDGECEAPAYILCGVIYDEDGTVLDSLGMVGVNSLDDPYLLECEGEMMIEAMARLDEESTRAARAYEASAVTYAGPVG